MYQDLLAQTGLNQNQAQIYELLLKEGALTAGELAKKSPLKRGLVYKTLDELVALELAKEEKKSGAVANFSALHPNQLREIIRNKEESLIRAKKGLDQVLPQLLSEYNLSSGKPGIKFYEGREGIRLVVADSLTSTTEIYSYVDPEAVDEIIGTSVNLDQRDQRQEKGLVKKVLTIDQPSIRERYKKVDQQFTQVRFMDEKITRFNTVMQIYSNKISYLTLTKENIIGVIIEDKNIYSMQKAIFTNNWQTAKS